jgi:hypothetical protein
MDDYIFSEVLFIANPTVGAYGHTHEIETPFISNHTAGARGPSPLHNPATSSFSNYTKSIFVQHNAILFRRLTI